MAKYDQSGAEAAQPKTPFKLFMVPSAAVQRSNVPKDIDEVMADLASFPVGTDLMDVYACGRANGDKEFQPTEGGIEGGCADPFLLGKMVTTTECTTTAYGDAKFFIRHQPIEADWAENPSILDQYDADTARLTTNRRLHRSARPRARPGFSRAPPARGEGRRWGGAVIIWSVCAAHWRDERRCARRHAHLGALSHVDMPRVGSGVGGGSRSDCKHSVGKERASTLGHTCSTLPSQSMSTAMRLALLAEESAAAPYATEMASPVSQISGYEKPHSRANSEFFSTPSFDTPTTATRLALYAGKSSSNFLPSAVHPPVSARG